MPAFTKPTAKTVDAFTSAEYVELPPSIVGDAAALRTWLDRGRGYVATLPKKAKAKKAR